MRIRLEFSPEQGSQQRARLDYAFSLFCALCGHEKVDSGKTRPADMDIVYSGPSRKISSVPTLQLSSLYTARPIHQPAPRPTPFEKNSKSTVLFHAPVRGAEPDWLGEIFEWVSCADEYSITSRDSLGRIDFRDSYVGRHRLDLTVPYAAVAMQFLNEALCQSLGTYGLERDHEDESRTHFVINTHDVDILAAGYFRSLYRLAKYSLISLLKFKSVGLAASQAAGTLAAAFGGANRLDQSDSLIRREASEQVGATYFFIANQGHRRDANYRIHDPGVIKLMKSVEREQMEVALHGSYCSLDRPDGLTAECELMLERGFQVYGNRQHWLRFTLDRLIPAMERSGTLYDTSLGWDCCGFRSGACFAFPPYNFESERAARFLEIPLAVMEIGLVTSGTPAKTWFDQVVRVLSASRTYGRGGISILWHPTAFGGAQLPKEIERIFWKLIEERQRWNDTWISALDFIRLEAQRFIKVGLLPPEYGSAIMAPTEALITSSTRQ